MGDEDCLTVNVQRPLTGENLPVFIWIYGGGYNTGYSSDPMYTGEAFVRDGILFFSFNYRTNILGFYDFTTYPGCEDFDSNCGLTEKQKEMFEDYMTAQREVNVLADCETFIYSFRLATKIMIDVLTDGVMKEI